MKKIITTMMAMIMMLSLVGCGGNTSSSSTENEVNSQVSTDMIVKAATDITVNTNTDTKVNNVDAAVDTTTNTNVETTVNTVDTTVDTTVENSANLNTDTAVAPQEQDDGIAGQTLNEYLATENRTPRYFYINPIFGSLDELTDTYPDTILKLNVILIYFGEEMIPNLGEEVAVIPINIGYEIYEMTLEDLINEINSYQIAEVTEVPGDLTTINSKYSNSAEGRMYDDMGMPTVRWEISKQYNGQEPKYFIYDTSAGAFKELTEENKMMFYDTGVICVYFGTNAMPDEYEEVAMVSPFMYKSLEEMSLEELIEAIKDSGITARQTFMDVAMSFAMIY